MNQDDTFKKLKQTPLDEMAKLYDEFINSSASAGNIPPIYQISTFALERKTYYPEILRHRAKLEFVKSHGWELEDLCLALEKRAIIEQVEIYNRETCKFSQEVLDRATFFFPNAKFIQAKIELE